LSRLRGLRSDLIDPVNDAHHVRAVERTRDGSLVEFRRVVDAVRCAVCRADDAYERNARALRYLSIASGLLDCRHRAEDETEAKTRPHQSPNGPPSVMLKAMTKKLQRP
jgi:hypothetical protein